MKAEAQIIGILGGGQLGRMMILAGRPLNLRFIVWDPGSQSPAGRIADQHIAAAYDDEEALRQFTEACDIATVETEHIPLPTLEAVEKHQPLAPASRIVSICQNRRLEREFLASAGAPQTPHRVVDSLATLKQAVAELGTPCVLKSATAGYDGKGQIKLNSAEDAESAWSTLGVEEAVVEAWIEYVGEYSVVLARNPNGQIEAFPVAENQHENHILRRSIVPARLLPERANEAIAIARNIAERIGAVGILTVEFFLTENGEWLVNELAPRPHNSGHWSIDGCEISQFEQHLRAILNWPLVYPRLTSPTVMLNLLGKEAVWDAEHRARLLAVPGLHVHLYAKAEARTGRKMGHLNLTAEANAEALNRAALAELQVRDEAGLSDHLADSYGPEAAAAILAIRSHEDK